MKTKTQAEPLRAFIRVDGNNYDRGCVVRVGLYGDSFSPLRDLTFSFYVKPGDTYGGTIAYMECYSLELHALQRMTKALTAITKRYENLVKEFALTGIPQKAQAFCKAIGVTELHVGEKFTGYAGVNSSLCPRGSRSIAPQDVAAFVADLTGKLLEAVAA